MRKMFNEGNAGLARRFSVEDAFSFKDYTEDELLELLLAECRRIRVGMAGEALAEAMKVLKGQKRAPNFGNGGAVKNLVARAMLKMESRLPPGNTSERSFAKEDFSLGTSPESATKGFAGLYNTESVLAHINDLRLLVEDARRWGQDTNKLLKHYVFVGRSGTGKTTVARLMAQVLHELELLPRNAYVEVNAKQLQGAYVGTTAAKVEQNLIAARGGVMFIDEAYGLHPSKGQFAEEAYETLLQKLTSPDYQNNLVVILAGYEKEVRSAFPD